MSGQLDEREIESLLREELVARIAYVDRRGYPYIVPITYAYDGKAFFGYSIDGSKLEGMRQAPRVCVEVDSVEDAADWRSVVAHGHFEELRNEAARAAVQLLSQRLTAIAIVRSLPAAAGRTYVSRLNAPGVAYRITIDSKRGRFSRSGEDP